MRCTDVVKRLYDEKGWDVNKSLLIHYDNVNIVRPTRDRFLRRKYSEKNYFDLKWAIKLSRSGVSLSAIKEILLLNKDIMTLTAQALRDKSKSDWLTAEEIKDRLDT